MANIFESAFMTLKNGMTMYFADSKARELIRKLQTAMSLIHEIPAGGTTDQVLKKASNDDFDVEWGAGGGGVANTWYATCSTAAGTAAKVATSATGDFVLATGNMVRVLFSDTNIQTQPTLSVDGSTAKRIKNITTDNNITTNLWRAGEVVDLVYDGTQFVVSDGGLANGTYYGRTKLSNSTSSSSQTTAASSKAVKDTYDAIPSASSAAPQDLGTAAAGSSTDYSRADHVHNLPTMPSPSSATPQDLGTAAAGSSADYSRADHVHNKPTYSKSDIGLGNVDNVQQYSASNPPPYPVTSVNGNTGAVTVPTIAVQDSTPVGDELVWIDTDEPGTTHELLEMSDFDSGFDSGAGHCKMPDGTLIQWGVQEYKSGSTSAYVSPINITNITLTMPIPFADTNYIVFGSGKWGSGMATPIGFQSASSTIYAGAHWWDAAARTFSASTPLVVRWCAIGRWK